jgi:hypothetical protein
MSQASRDRIIEAIDDAIERNDALTLTSLLTAHSELINLDVGNITWLHRAAQRGCLDAVQALVALGLSVNARRPQTPDQNPEGPVYSAVIGGHAHVVKWLLEHGANSNCTVQGVVRNFALSSAASHGHFEIVKLLVEYGADVNATWSGRNALSNAWGHPEIYFYLKSKGAKLPEGDDELPEYDFPGSDDPVKVVVRHMTRHYGKPKPLAFQEIVPSALPIAVHVVPASTKRKAITLFTTGMSAEPLTVPEGRENYRFAELVLRLPADWPMTPKAIEKPENLWPFLALRSVARRPHEQKTWLDTATILENGSPAQPLAAGVPFTAWLALTDESETGRALVADGRVIQFYLLVPLYPEEVRLEREKGITELIKLFQKHKVSMTVDLNRKNVAKTKRK